MAIDKEKLPENAFFDTSSLLDVLIGKNQPEWNVQRTREAELARQFYTEIVNARGTVFSSSVALAEIIRGGALKSPRFQGLMFYAFDNECARILGEKFPTNMTPIGTPGQPKACIKFDTLIISTALRVAPKFPFITADEHQLKRATKAGLVARKPSEYATQQGDLFEVGGPEQDR